MASARPDSLSAAAVAVLAEPQPPAKVRLTEQFAADWTTGLFTEIGRTPPPDRPARPARPELRPPRDMPKRSKGGIAGRRAFVHALAHIELNAIDLAWDVIARFTTQSLPDAFYDEWVEVAGDEARHFRMLSDRLADLGAAYGDLPAHDGLWEAAEATADDLMGRLAVVPMVLEARGLDTTPAAARRFSANGDEATAAILETIGEDEIGHVAAGVRWYEFLAAERGLDPVETFHGLVRERFRGQLKPPFNEQARARAGMAAAYYAG